MKNLFNGISLIIDDEYDKKDDIKNLIQQIENENMPFIAFKMIPNKEMIKNFSGISFVLLDWKLTDEEVTESVMEGVTLPSTLEESLGEENIEFLKQLKENVFAPVFIFTNEPKETIITKLRENGLYQDDKPTFILIKNKDELTNDRLFSAIEEWIRSIPSIYVLKKWEESYQKAKNQLFWDFYERSPIWPKIIWDCYKKDLLVSPNDQTDYSKNLSRELGEVITRNLYTRMAPFCFEETTLQTATAYELSEVPSVLEGERFLKANFLNPDEIFTGDLFREEYENQETHEMKSKYWLNIRAQCDLVRNSDPELYCIKGRILDESKAHYDNGAFIERNNQAIVAFIDDGKFIEFLFSKFEIKKWSKLKDKRIGRLLPPYITRIQQQYSLYFQRQGLPRTPEELIPKPRAASNE